MSERGRAALLAALLCLPLVAVAASFVLGSDGEETAAAETTLSKDELAEAAEPAVGANELDTIAAGRAKRVGEAVAEEEKEAIAAAETASRAQPSEFAQAVIAEAEPVARRFYAAYSLYEVGEGGPEIARELRKTTSVALAHQLLETDPVRIPLETEAPGRASLGPLTVRIPPSEEEPRAIVLVGETLREGERAVLALEMIKADPRYGWRVAGLGR